jgi:hypothetical protein
MKGWGVRLGAQAFADLQGTQVVAVQCENVEAVKLTRNKLTCNGSAL